MDSVVEGKVPCFLTSFRMQASDNAFNFPSLPAQIAGQGWGTLGSFVAQGFYGIQLRGTHRRDKAANDSNQQ